MNNAAIAAYRGSDRPWTKFYWDIANVIGLSEALLIQILQSWCKYNAQRKNRDYYHDGAWWTSATYEQWANKYPAIGSPRTFQRLLTKLESLGYVISEQFNKGKNNSKSYRVNEAAVGELLLNALDDPTVPDWHDDTDVLISSCQNATTTVPKEDDHRANLACSPYINRSIKDHSLDQSPLTPQRGEEREQKFGFEIPEETNSSFSASLQSDTNTRLTTSQSVMTNVPLAAQDPFFRKHRKASDVVWDWLPDGPWKINGKLCPSFVEAIAKRWVEDYGGNIHKAKAKLQKHFRNEPTNLPIEWEWYQSTYLHKVANIQARKQSGIDTSKDEQEIIKHASAFNDLPDEMRVTQSQTATEFIENNVSYAVAAITQSQKQALQLESVATVPEDVWDALPEGVAAGIAHQSEQIESQNLVPEGAENLGAYKVFVDRDASDFYRNLDEQNKAAPAKTSDRPIVSPQEAKSRINALIASKSMPSVSTEDRQRFKEEERLARKIADWQKLLQSGLSSAIADVERQANAQGYVIVDGRIEEVEF